MSPSATVLASVPGICRPTLTGHRSSLGELMQPALTALLPDRVFPARNTLARNSNRRHTALDSGAAQSRTPLQLPNTAPSTQGRLPLRRALPANQARSRQLSNSPGRRLQDRTQDLPNPYRETRNSRQSPHRRNQTDHRFRSLSGTSVWRIQGFGVAFGKRVGARGGSIRRPRWLSSGPLAGRVDHPSLGLLEAL